MGSGSSAAARKATGVADESRAGTIYPFTLHICLLVDPEMFQYLARLTGSSCCHCRLAWSHDSMSRKSGKQAQVSQLLGFELLAVIPL